ncbi:hypothetical protein PIB30_011417 [Stylosanthes scabra]|uniref:Uncharacterized protein n=1 Tax=Stylosanthes scabra TaxID=79078 RepID=A0ABU6Z2H5_9FABA|nr:hypothetical protein [Stylosanthes scabra]
MSIVGAIKDDWNRLKNIRFLHSSGNKRQGEEEITKSVRKRRKRRPEMGRPHQKMADRVGAETRAGQTGRIGSKRVGGHSQVGSVTGSGRKSGNNPESRPCKGNTDPTVEKTSGEKNKIADVARSEPLKGKSDQRLLFLLEREMRMWEPIFRRRVRRLLVMRLGSLESSR